MIYIQIIFSHFSINYFTNSPSTVAFDGFQGHNLLNLVPFFTSYFSTSAAVVEFSLVEGPRSRFFSLEFSGRDWSTVFIIFGWEEISKMTWNRHHYSVTQGSRQNSHLQTSEPSAWLRLAWLQLPSWPWPPSLRGGAGPPGSPSWRPAGPT